VKRLEPTINFDLPKREEGIKGKREGMANNGTTSHDTQQTLNGPAGPKRESESTQGERRNGCQSIGVTEISKSTRDVDGGKEKKTENHITTRVQGEERIPGLFFQKKYRRKFLSSPKERRPWRVKKAGPGS